MENKNTIIGDFQNNIVTQFIGIITFGFGVTAFYSALQTYIITNIFHLSVKDIIFIFFSFIGSIISCYILKEKNNIKIKIIKSLDFTITILGFVLMFVPLIILFQKFFEPNISFEYLIVKNSIISLIIAIILFLFKSTIKYFLTKNLSNIKPYKK